MLGITHAHTNVIESERSLVSFPTWPFYPVFQTHVFNMFVQLDESTNVHGFMFYASYSTSSTQPNCICCCGLLCNGCVPAELVFHQGLSIDFPYGYTYVPSFGIQYCLLDL